MPHLPPRAFLHECFDYDPVAGVIHWRHRPDHHFKYSGQAADWNRRNAGNRCFTRPDREGYLAINLTYAGSQSKVRMHRVIFVMMIGREPEIVDHRDFDPGNNRWENLREATHRTSSCNRRKWASKILPKGVTMRKGRYYAQVKFAGVRYSLGGHATAGAAHAAYRAKAAELQGGFFHDGARADDIFG